MTRWAEFPLRPQGQPWPGLNTRGGRLDPGQGQLEEGSFGVIINEADILEKRKGFVRGLDERFDTVVCGLFRYTDEWGVEYVVVADASGIKVRTPFDIPTYLGSDSLPNDDFETLDATRWSPTLSYESFLGDLQLNLLSNPSTLLYVEDTRLMQWFKPSVLTSYYVEIQYLFVVGAALQVASVAIKRGSSWLQGNVYLDGTAYRMTLELVSTVMRTTLASADLSGAVLGTGFLRLSYVEETRTATLRAIPSGGSQASISGTINELQAASLGQNSAIGLSRADESQVQIARVIGGSV